MRDLLSIEHLSAGYGEAVVLSGISLSVAEGQALALLGRNGMGKTTLITIPEDTWPLVRTICAIFDAYL